MISAPSPAPRDYTRVAPPESSGGGVSLDAIVRALWEEFRTRADGDFGYSWVGFYLGAGGSTPDAIAREGEMILSVREPKPACSPISLEGACGRCFLSGRPLVVRDVKALGANYIACDPRDRSEVVVPYFDADGRVLGVLDVDSFDAAAFTAHDAVELVKLLRRTGVCHSTGPIEPIEVG